MDNINQVLIFLLMRTDLRKQRAFRFGLTCGKNITTGSKSAKKFSYLVTSRNDKYSKSTRQIVTCCNSRS